MHNHETPALKCLCFQAPAKLPTITYPPAAEEGDAVIELDGGDKLQAHSFCLAAASPHFKEALAGHTHTHNKTEQSIVLPRAMQPLLLVCPCLEPASIRSSCC